MKFLMILKMLNHNKNIIFVTVLARCVTFHPQEHVCESVTLQETPSRIVWIEKQCLNPPNASTKPRNVFFTPPDTSRYPANPP